MVSRLDYQLIIDKLCDLIRLQNRFCVIEGRKAILAAGLKSLVVIEENESVVDLVSKLFRSPYCDKDEVFKLQHNIYVGLIKIELGGIDKELISINARSARLRRDLKLISNDDVFKLCNDLVDKKKLNDRKDIGHVNDRIWSVALEKKKANDVMIKDWKEALSAVHDFYKNDDQVPDKSVSRKSIESLSTSSMVFASFEPIGVEGIESLSTSSMMFANFEPVCVEVNDDDVGSPNPTPYCANVLTNNAMKKPGPSAVITVTNRSPMSVRLNDVNKEPLLPNPLRSTMATTDQKRRPFSDRSNEQPPRGTRIVYNDRMGNGRPFRNSGSMGSYNGNQVESQDRSRGRYENGDNRYAPYGGFRYR